jgi:hypothetical protein
MILEPQRRRKIVYIVDRYSFKTFLEKEIEGGGGRERVKEEGGRGRDREIGRRRLRETEREKGGKERGRDRGWIREREKEGG